MKKISKNAALSRLLNRLLFEESARQNFSRPFIVLAFVFALCVFGYQSQAQTPAIVYSDWSMLGEDTSHIDISYRIVKCDLMSASAIHLKLFNENPISKTTNFSITVTNQVSGATSVTQHTIVLDPAVIDEAKCGDNGPYVVPVPAGYDPSQISLSINFL